MTAPLVSFVMPCYAYAQYLPQCMDSVLGLQGDFGIEVIAINDCSPDNTLDVLRAYAGRDARVRVIDHEVNRGHVYSVNEGFRAARGKYVVRIDPDDRYVPAFLQHVLPVLESDPAVGLVYGDVALIDASGSVTLERTPPVHPGPWQGNEFVALLKRNFICAPTVIARREAWMSAWPVPEGLAFNDWYFNLMIARRWTFAYVPEVLAHYRVHGSNHHTRIGRDRTEEQSVLWLLDTLYSETEDDAGLERAKRAARDDAYASHWLDFAFKYWGHGMDSDARRCFWRAARLRPSVVLQARVVRLWLASFLPRPWYEAAKRLARGS